MTRRHTLTELMKVHVLRDGHRILVRPLLASDRDQLEAGYAKVSPASRRSRFGSAPDRLTPRQLDRLVDLDYNDRFALAAFALDEPGEPGIGVARYARSKDGPTVAEAAVLVLDEYQNRGIGSILLWDLIAVAKERRIHTFTATVMWDSVSLLGAIQAAGATVEPAEPGVAAVRFHLPDEVSAAASLSGGRRWTSRRRDQRRHHDARCHVPDAQPQQPHDRELPPDPSE